MALEIRSARYGIGKKPDEYVDVTKVISKLVTPKGLKLPRVSNESLGLGPVFKGRRKRLWIDYVIDGQPGTAATLERKSLRIKAR